MNKMCYHPWVGLDVSPQGEFKPCCKFKTSMSSSLTDYKNSEQLSILRDDFVNGKRNDGCYRCWQDEDAGLQSKREIDNQYVFQNIPPSLDTVKVISIPFGNTCNLACRTCNSGSSSRWAAEERKLLPKFPELIIRQHVKFYKDSNFMNEITEMCQDALHIEFPGGEPLLTGINEHKKFLSSLKNSANISLHYMTNTTVFPDDELLALWKTFKKVDIKLSIDGIGEHFEYNRWPAIWDDCEKNIKKYINYRNTEKNIQLSVSHCVSILTVFYLPEFVSWCTSVGLPTPYLGIVSKPSHYSIKTFGINTKNKISDKLKFNELFIPVINLMNSEHQQLRTEFNSTLDQHRNQRFNKTFPELFSILEKDEQILFG